MSKISITPNASGTGVFTISSPATNTDRTLTLPDEAGTVDLLQRAGNVLQVVQGTYSTITSTSSASYVTTNLTASITPTSTSNKILITAYGVFETVLSGRQAAFTIYRGDTNLAAEGFAQVYSSAGGNVQGIAAMSYLDSPATTSSTAYTIYFASTAGAGAVTIFSNSFTGTIVLMEIAG